MRHESGIKINFSLDTVIRQYRLTGEKGTRRLRYKLSVRASRRNSGNAEFNPDGYSVPGQPPKEARPRVSKCNVMCIIDPVFALGLHRSNWGSSDLAAGVDQVPGFNEDGRLAAKDSVLFLL